MSAALVVRLENWARHFRDRPRYGKAGSAEGNYRSPSPDYSALLDLFPEFKGLVNAPQTRLAPPDVKDATRVQQAVTRLPDERHRLILAMWHIRKLPAPRIERTLRLGARGFELCYYGALRELEYQLSHAAENITQNRVVVLQVVV